MNDHAGWTQDLKCVLCGSDDASKPCTGFSENEKLKEEAKIIQDLQFVKNALKDRLLSFLSAPGLDGFKISYLDIMSLSVEEDFYIIQYESYFNPHAAPKQLKDVKKFTSLIDAVNFFYSIIEEHKS